ncbi:MAG: hypothetical protein AB7O50_14735 [Pseudolabrys sp.]
MRLSAFAAVTMVAAATLAAAPTGAAAQGYEAPPSFNAAKIAGIERVGGNYSILNPVGSDGFLRTYRLQTKFGEFAIRGDDMVKLRINELRALALLEQVSHSKTFAEALAKAGISPLKFAGELIVKPVDTVKNTLSGVGAVFGRIGSGISNAGQSPDNALASIIGVTSERREIAAAYGVDPYTDFPPLDEKLKQLSQAAALGGLTVTGALLAVPGAAGIVASNLSTVTKVSNLGVEELARKYTGAQILDVNRDLLTKMGVPAELNARLLANRNYTPIDMLAMVAALDSMKGVGDRVVFAERAAAADQRDIAYYFRRQAELLALEQRRRGGMVRFVSLVGDPFVVMRDGRIVTLAPIDALSWTRPTAEGLGAITAARKEIAPKSAGEIRITGMATPLARKQLKVMGWKLVEGVRL